MISIDVFIKRFNIQNRINNSVHSIVENKLNSRILNLIKTDEYLKHWTWQTQNGHKNKWHLEIMSQAGTENIVKNLGQ